MAWTGVGGKQVLITGATNGIGLAAARELARRGAELVIVGRDPARTEAAARSIGGADLLIADFSSLGAVRRLSEEVVARYPRLQVLINNAGAMHTGRRVTADGLELTWAVNHLAPFLLTSLLLDRLRASAPARIVTTSSDAHRGARIPFDDLAGEKTYGRFGLGRYGQTKLANILFTLELARRLKGSGVEAYCFHPGLVASGFNRNNGPLMAVGMTLLSPFARTPEQGAETLVWLADSAEVEGQSGGYFEDCRRSVPSREAQDAEVARRLWAVSEEQVRGYSSR